jgi:hypothetical protein
MDITGLGSIFSFASTVIDKIFPDPAQRDAAKLELFKQQQAGAFKELEADLAIAQGQMAINQTEAASPDVFRGGWRPFIGWVCGVGCAWNWLGLPVAKVVAELHGTPIAMSPADLSEMMPILMGMLGLGGLRTFERVKGVVK